jgi:hypothetical protein
MTITDAAFPANNTVIVYTAPRLQEFPQSIFNVNNLAR